MQHLRDALARRPPRSKASSERAELIAFFTDKINADRDGKRYKKLPVRAIAVKLSHLSLHDLHYLRSICLDAERRGTAFGKVFFGQLKSQQSN